jgi:SpoVK/Ycf46/Vps4 family AAA+-type ATPase
MARADLLLSLVRAGAKGDQRAFRRTVEAMVADERGRAASRHRDAARRVPGPGTKRRRWSHLPDFLAARGSAARGPTGANARGHGAARACARIKRVASSLLLSIDALPSYVVVVGASNHPERLDRAVWRRFQVRTELPAPGDAEVLAWIRKFEAATSLALGISDRAACDHLCGLSYAELEEFCLDIQRRVVLDGPGAKPSAIARAVLKQWGARRNVNVHGGTRSGRKR